MRLAPALAATLWAQGAVAGAVSFWTDKEVLGVPDGQVEAEVAIDANGQPTLSLKLAPGPAEQLADLTRRNIGKPMDLRICGEVVMSPTVRTEIASGELTASGGLTADRAQGLADRVASACGASGN